MRTGEQIKAARKFLGESQSAFAERFGVDQSTVARWEANGSPDRGTAAVAIDNFLASLPTSDAECEPNSQSAQA